MGARWRRRCSRCCVKHSCTSNQAHRPSRLSFTGLALAARTTRHLPKREKASACYFERDTPNILGEQPCLCRCSVTHGRVLQAYGEGYIPHATGAEGRIAHSQHSQGESSGVQHCGKQVPDNSCHRLSTTIGQGALRWLSCPIRPN